MVGANMKILILNPKFIGNCYGNIILKNDKSADKGKGSVLKRTNI